MNVSAQNALLKTLEEPPDGSLLILISSSAGGLLPTLLSRCLRVAFAPLPASAVADYLIARRAHSAERARLLAAASLGSIGRAIGSDLEELAQKRAAWVTALALLGKKDCREWLALAEALSEDREESLKFLNWLADWYRDVLIYHATESLEAICNLDLGETLTAEAARCDVEQARSEERRVGKECRL